MVKIFRGLSLHADACDVIDQLPASAVVELNRVAESFDSLLQAERYDQAESFLQECIQTQPDAPGPHRLLAQLLNSQGRRFEASQSVRQLIRLRSTSRIELLSLIDIGGPFLLVDFRPIVRDGSAALFGMHEARRIWSSARPDYPKAIRQLKQIDQRYHSHPAYVALSLRFYAESGQWKSFEKSLADSPVDVAQHPEYWLALGAWYLDRNEVNQATAALIECLKLDPTNRNALRMLIESQDSMDDESMLLLQSWLADLEKLFRISRDATPDQISWIIGTLQKRIRPWEAAGWTKVVLEGGRRSIPTEVVEKLDATHAQITQWEAKYNQDQIRLIRLQQNIPKTLQNVPTPKAIGRESLRANSIASRIGNENASSDNSQQVFRFDAVAKNRGIDTAYVNHYPSSGSDFFLYQANGGGLAVIDYDLDGNLDTYMAQAGGTPFESNSVANQMFRQFDGRFIETTDLVSDHELGYGQGVCVGDVNQDGFPDIVVANIGRNELLINQGDGTFLRRRDLLEQNEPRWTSSIGLADLDGDHLPDMVEVNYINDPRALTTRCKQPFDVCQPQTFTNAKDQFFRSKGDGSFERIDERNKATWFVGDAENRYGFGVIIANFDDRCGNDLFISNDGDLNHFWQSTCDPSKADPGQTPENEAPSTDSYRLAESATLAGCAVGRSGNSQACMGVAAGDLDGNGRLDLHVCNFFGESSNLFLQVRPGFFSDDIIRRGIEPLSKQYLGFGTQAADFDNDGRLDLFVLNGHIFNREDPDEPFRMRPQLLAGGERGFASAKLDASEESIAFWNRPAIGRTVAVGDFNRDGKADLICNHLDQPVEILENKTESGGRWITFELIGTFSERDAIGAKVKVIADGTETTGWMIGGDGYMCTNESVVHLGLGQDCHAIERVEIGWPSGKQQSFSNLNTDQRYLVVEGATEIFQRAPE